MYKIAVEDEFRKEKSSFVNGTNDRGAHPKRLIAALVQVNCEKRVAKRLEDLGVVNYVPTPKEVHNWSDRRKVIHRVVIPSIVFVRISQDAEDEFRGSCQGLVDFCCGVNNTELAIRLELLGYATTRISKNDVIMI